MTHKSNVKMLYKLFNARWYNPFRYYWTHLFSHSSEKKFLSLLKHHVRPSSSILELGCGTGVNIPKIEPFLFKSYLGLDFSSSMLAIAKKKRSNRVSFLRGDLTKIPVKKNYDLIISTWVLSHIYQPAKMINAYYNRLSRDGVMVLMFLTKPAWYLRFWVCPLLRLFAAKCLEPHEIAAMSGKKKIYSFNGGLTTLLVIKRR